MCSLQGTKHKSVDRVLDDILWRKSGKVLKLKTEVSLFKGIER